MNFPTTTTKHFNAMKTTNPKDFVALLEVYRIAIINGILNKKEVIQWADSIISKDSEPDIFIIELSLCGSKIQHDITSLINEFIGEERTNPASRVILGLLFKKYTNGQIDLEKVNSTLNWLVWQTDLTEEESSLMYGAEDYYYLAKEGSYGTVEQIKAELLAFLGIYKDFRLDNFDEWTTIDATIHPKVISHVANNNKEQVLQWVGPIIKAKKKWWQIWRKA
jgi:hypothetical protein